MPISRIKTDGIQDDAVTSAKIGDTNVQTGDIATGAVTTAKIADGDVTTAKLDTGAVTSAKLDTGAVTSAKLDTGAVTSAKLDTNIDIAGTLDVTGVLTADSDVVISDDFKFGIGATPTLGVGTQSPNRKLHVYGDNASGAEISLTNTDMTADRRTQNFFMSADKAHWRLLNDAGNAGGTAATLDWDGVLDAAAFTGTSGTAYGALYSHSIGDSNVPYNSWGTPNSTYYRWVLPKAGVYELYSEMRCRLWGVGGIIISRLYNNTTSAVINEIGGGTTVRMNFEDSNNANSHLFNFQISHRWIVETTADNQDIHHQMNSNNNSTNSSVQSDYNGWNMHMWKRIG